jgi:hypothetical protein
MSWNGIFGAKKINITEKCWLTDDEPEIDEIMCNWLV